MLCYVISVRIFVSQHSRDKLLMDNLVNVLGCGYIFKHPNKNSVTYAITKFEDIHKKIIPLFDKSLILGEKSKDFEDFCKVVRLVNKGTHLTLEGLEEIRKIKSRMNRARYIL